MEDVVFGRRRLLGLGLAATGMVVAGCGTDGRQDGRRPVPAAVEVAARPAIDEDVPVLRSEFVFSEYRRTNLQLLVAYPSGLGTTQGLPMVGYLHGKDGVAPTPIPFGTLAALEREHREGRIPPFGFVALDGGYNAYWTNGSANGDVLSMLTGELPRWLVERGLGGPDGQPFACGGISTGAFGALNYAIERQRSGPPLTGVAALAPALPVTWPHMREKGVFATEAQWRAADPLRRLDELGDVPLGVWVGQHDPFLVGAERLAKEHRNTPVFEVLPGGHDPSVFDTTGTSIVHFLARGLRTSGQVGR